MIRFGLNSCGLRKGLITLLAIIITSQASMNTFGRPGISTVTPMSSAKKIDQTMDFTLVGSLIIVEATVHKQSGNYILDTGANISMVNSKYFVKKGWPLEEDNIGFTGKIGPARRSHASFSWQDFHLKWVAFNVLDLSHLESILGIPVHGFIGYDILRHFELVIDYPNKSLTLTKTRRQRDISSTSRHAAPPDHVIPFRMNRHLPCLPATIGDHSIELGVDLGSAVNLLDGDICSQLLSHPVPRHPVKLVGFAAEGILGQTFELDGLKVGDLLDLPPSPYTLYDFEQLNKVLAYPIQGLLGFGALAPYRLGINYRKKELYLWSVPRELQPNNLREETLAE